MSCCQRIACLSTEVVETLYALGAEQYIAGISGFTTRPERARSEKPKISGFSSSKLERILDVQPDLVIGFSNLQAEICNDLAKSADILSPGPAAITEGLQQLTALVARWQQQNAA
jgi:iron complex transport system substrate-binding protein